MWQRLREFFARELVILIDPTNTQHARRRKQVTAVIGSTFALGMAAAMGVAPGVPNDDPNQPRVAETIKLPDLRAQLDQLVDSNQTFIRQERMQRGETVASLLRRLSVEDPDAATFIRRNATARGLFDLKPGQTVLAETDSRNTLVSLQATLGGDAATSRQLVIERVKDTAEPSFRARIDSVSNEIRHEMRSGEFRRGFFNGMDAANVPDAVVEQVVSIFSGVIDFHHDIDPGDRFRIVYEAGFQDGEFVRNGRVVAVELINNNRVHQALWYSRGANGGAYYTFDGRSMKRAFLRAPIEFSRMSSGFGGRNHPIYDKWHAHKGVDFAAPAGTKVFAASDATVEFTGRQNGYGNLIILQHGRGYSTYYAHLSGFASGLKPGQRVTQGEVIGYVGSTGWATGPHLHYEFRVDNVPQNPLMASELASPALAGKAREQFLSYTAQMLSRINALRTFNVLASNN
jgi:murein DD-endopeptidase MepM/ murein hydrolase activator NlpD